MYTHSVYVSDGKNHNKILSLVGNNTILLIILKVSVKNNEIKQNCFLQIFRD